MKRVSDRFDNVAEFVELLEEADSKDLTAWEEKFLSRMHDIFAGFDERMYLSDKQLAILERIARK